MDAESIYYALLAAAEKLGEVNSAADDLLGEAAAAMAAAQ